MVGLFIYRISCGVEVFSFDYIFTLQGDNLSSDLVFLLYFLMKFYLL
uniref:Uncharacterized protein n=1 Tax=Nelumbo nucifera TaxID=4432 RepID=A0A822Y7D2_NELNU|nr:TPA_asm: hypothetical protein HUJ06_028707 [Nelumbo nucifera]